ncbi:hypothetical protein B0J14DRAFT_600182, partial [Halenospora varia]
MSAGTNTQPWQLRSNIPANPQASYQNTAASPLTSFYSETDRYLLGLKEGSQRILWRDIVKKFKAKWPAKDWTEPQLQMRWQRLRRGPPLSPIPYMVSPSTTPVPLNDACLQPPSSYKGPRTASTVPAIPELRFNSLSKTYNEYVPLEPSTFSKCEEHGAGSLLGILYYGNHPIQWISILGTVSSLQRRPIDSTFTITDKSGTTLECGWSFPAGSTQPISDHLKHISPLMQLGHQYQYYSPMNGLQLEMDILATGRLGRYGDKTCLHIYYLHTMPSCDADDFRRCAAEYRENVLDHPWIIASPDQRGETYEDRLIRLLQSPTAAELVYANSAGRPACDWRCPDQGCSEFNFSYSSSCVRCKHARIPLPLLPERPYKCSQRV